MAAAAARDQAAALLAASQPGDVDLPSTWPGWARLLPHLLALNPDASNPALSDLTGAAVWYLIRRGGARNGYDLASSLYQHRLAQDGPDDPGTLTAANTLATVLSETGRYGKARELDEDTLARAAASWATTIPTPSGPPATSPPTCARLASSGRPGS